MNEGFLKKYGLWIGGGVLLLVLLVRNKATTRPPLAPTQGGGAANDQLTLERLRQGGQLDLERLRANSNLEALRMKQEFDRFNLEQQLLARNRAIDAQQKQQTIGLIGQIAAMLANALKGGSQQQGKGQTSAQGGFGTPPFNPDAGRPRSLPSYSIPVPNINPFDSFVPDWPAPPTEYPLSVTDWGEAPAFAPTGLSFDSGGTFFDQMAGAFGGGGDFNYGYGYDQAFSDYPYTSDVYDPYASGGNIGIDDFYYGYGSDYTAGADSYSDAGYSDIGAGDDFNYGYGTDE